MLSHTTAVRSAGKSACSVRRGGAGSPSALPYPNVTWQVGPPLMLQLIGKWPVPGLTMAYDCPVWTVTWKNEGPGWLLSDSGVPAVTW